jgi:hypothetical protein
MAKGRTEKGIIVKREMKGKNYRKTMEGCAACVHPADRTAMQLYPNIMSTYN